MRNPEDHPGLPGRSSARAYVSPGLFVCGSILAALRTVTEGPLVQFLTHIRLIINCFQDPAAKRCHSIAELSTGPGAEKKSVAGLQF